MKVNGAEAVSSVSRQNFNNENNSSENIKEKNNMTIQPESLQKKNKKTEENLEENIKESVKDINDIVKKVKEDLAFEIHDETEQMMVKVIDLKTQEVIKELPPEEMLDLAARIHKMVGLLIDEKV